MAKKNEALSLVENSIPESIRLIEDKLKKYKHIQESVYVTKTNLRIEGEEVKIQSETSVLKLVKGLSNILIKKRGVEEAYQKLGIDTYPIIKIDGHTEDEWIADIQLRRQIIEQKETMDTLAALKKEAEDLMDKEDRKLLFQKKLESFLSKD